MGDPATGDGNATDPAAPVTPVPSVPPALPASRWRRGRNLTPTPAWRRLRVFALDPALATQYDTAALSVTTLKVAWEAELRPGPIGEYIEVIDVDPASDRAYPPVDLNHRALLAADGLAPSEGNPQFHQQMVYAVAMNTIGAFESALGRRAMWARHREVDADGHMHDRFVPRLRIYPHALRQNNAYYSPDKIAVLLGYFNATTNTGASVANNSMVFGCLSADIVAHEVTHALLDGMHRRYEEASNPDVPAFHEAFADIVALFQHFTNEDMVEWSVAQTRGELTTARMLAGLALQFGQATGRGDALRQYLAMPMDKLDYANTLEPHARGAILVRTVYEAFLTIVERRNKDLIALATGGTGVLPAGNLHPILVARLAHETAKVAGQVQRMCIRALDYCPPADITFGEYLRALMTADVEYVPDDRMAYRTAFIQAFRTASLLPGNLRTVSTESLVWRQVDKPVATAGWLKPAVAALGIDWGRDRDRAGIFAKGGERCASFWGALRHAFARHAEHPAAPGAADPAMFGLQMGLGKYDENFNLIGDRPPTNFEVHSVRRVRRVRPDGIITQQIVVTVAQRRPEAVDPADPSAGQFWFRGGATIIIDPFPAEGPEPRLRYVILKNIGSVNRLNNQRSFLSGDDGGLNALYFGALAKAEPFALLHSEAVEAAGEAAAAAAAKAAATANATGTAK